MTRMFFFACLASMALFGNGASADTNKIYAALETLANSQNGTAIAQGLIEYGQALGELDVGGTIAFRNSLQLLASSGQIKKETPTWNLLDTVWRQAESHLLHLCRTNPVREVGGPVNVYFGKPYPCRVDD